MAVYWKILGVSLISVILYPVIARHQRELAVPLAMLTAILAALAGLRFLEPIVDFLHQLAENSPVTGRYLPMLLKVAGIGISAELAGEACKEAGNSALGKLLPILGGVLILRESLGVYGDLGRLLKEVFMGC